jgi:uncharacterized membrane protein YvlD (DUF360 family)
MLNNICFGTYDRWDELERKPVVVVQEQANDPISLLGIWKKDWRIVRVTPPEDKKGPNSFCDHFLNYSGFAQTEFTYIDAAKENAQRRARNFWLYSVGRSIIYYSIIIPYNYLIRPVVYFAQRWLLALTLGLVSLIGTAILVGLAVSGVLSLLALVSTFFVSAVVISMYVVCHFLGDSSGGEGNYQFARLHDPRLSRNASMDIYNPDNQIEVEFTYKEINTYYQVMRCLVKQKEFLPEEGRHREAGNSISKRELLFASQKPENHDKVMYMTTTKAKVVHMRHALTLINQIGMENERELQQALELNYRHYEMGKHR